MAMAAAADFDAEATIHRCVMIVHREQLVCLHTVEPAPRSRFRYRTEQVVDSCLHAL